MAKKKAASSTTAPQIFHAARGARGEVIRGDQITEAQAIAERRAGRDVVVCGSDLAANRDMAKNIELAANGSYKRCPPHANAGANALPHYQPLTRPPAGHIFYETTKRKAK